MSARTANVSEQAKTNELAVTHILFLEIVDYVFVLWTRLHLKSYEKRQQHIATNYYYFLLKRV